MKQPVSVLITSLPGVFEVSLREFVRLGFAHVDLIGKAERPDHERAALADSGLIVDCVALGRDLPAGCSLDADNVTLRRRAVEHVERQIVDAAQLGARVAYVVQPKAEAALPAFADACGVLAAFARGRMTQFCVEHFPGSALPTAKGTLAWLPDDVKLVLDLGHCLISTEDPCQVVEAAGDRLGYVQLDDNDGVGDVHWPLLTGTLSEAMLGALLRRLDDSSYHGGIALELNGTLPDAVGNLARSKKLVEQLLNASALAALILGLAGV